jgi:hypothetical protein
MARKLLLFGLSLGAGYVLGARAGREQYDRMVAVARGIWDDPRVTRVRADVEAYARSQAPLLKERAESMGRALPGQVTEGVQRAAEVAAATAGRTTVVAQDIAGRTTIIAREATAKVTSTAHSVIDRVVDSGRTARAKATGTEPSN